MAIFEVLQLIEGESVNSFVNPYSILIRIAREFSSQDYTPNTMFIDIKVIAAYQQPNRRRYIIDPRALVLEVFLDTSGTLNGSLSRQE